MQSPEAASLWWSLRQSLSSTLEVHQPRDMLPARSDANCQTIGIWHRRSFWDAATEASRHAMAYKSLFKAIPGKLLPQTSTVNEEGASR